MSRGLRILILPAAVALVTACGARSTLEVDELGADPGGGGGVCDPTQSCDDLTRGTWRLHDADGVPYGYLFLFDATRECNGSATHFLLSLDLEDDGRRCSRNGDYVAEMSDDGLAGVATNLGGSTGELCGGTPFDETIAFALEPIACEPDRFRIRIEDDQAGAPYSFDGVARRCRCDIGWEQCVQALPEEPCGDAL